MPQILKSNLFLFCLASVNLMKMFGCNFNTSSIQKNSKILRWQAAAKCDNHIQIHCRKCYTVNQKVEIPYEKGSQKSPRRASLSSVIPPPRPNQSSPIQTEGSNISSTARNGLLGAAIAKGKVAKQDTVNCFTSPTSSSTFTIQEECFILQ